MLAEHPAGTSLRDAENGSDTLYAVAATGRAHKFALRHLLQSMVVRRQVLQFPLQPGILGLQLLEPSRLVDPPPTVPSPPSVEGCLLTPHIEPSV